MTLVRFLLFRANSMSRAEMVRSIMNTFLNFFRMKINFRKSEANQREECEIKELKAAKIHFFQSRRRFHNFFSFSTCTMLSNCQCCLVEQTRTSLAMEWTKRKTEKQRSSISFVSIHISYVEKKIEKGGRMETIFPWTAATSNSNGRAKKFFGNSIRNTEHTA